MEYFSSFISYQSLALKEVSSALFITSLIPKKTYETLFIKQRRLQAVS